MHQQTFAEVTFEQYRKPTRRERFLDEMNRVVPWAELVVAIEPVYPKADGPGRPPVGVERMLRLHCLQQWFNLSDPAVEEALYDSRAMRQFVGIDKPRAFSEIFRVLRPGGRVQIADIVLGKPIRPESRNNPQLWAEYIVGAVQEEDYLALVRAAGFNHVTVIGMLNYFSKSSDADTREVATKYGAKTVVIKGGKPS